MRIALTGGIACGKSLVAKYFNELGVATIDADDIVHEIIPAEERRRLAAIVFSDPAARKALEARIHPIVRERLAGRVSELASLRVSELGALGRALQTPPSCGVPPIEIIPLLFECNWQADYDIILCVRSARERQISRMIETRGYSRTEAEGRLAAQMPVDQKAELSNYIIENNSTPEALRAEVERAWAWLKGDYGRRAREDHSKETQG